MTMPSLCTHTALKNGSDGFCLGKASAMQRDGLDKDWTGA